MPLEKESLNNFLPDGFETNNLEGGKENFSADKIATGYEKDVKDRVSGPNFNNLLDVIGKNTNILTKFMDFIKNMPVNNLFAVDENNQLVYKNLDEVGGGGLEIGDIGIAPLGINENQNKRRYLNGQIISQIPFLSFTTKLKEAVALYPSLACTENEWQTIATMTVGGQVGKFVIDDDAGTIRLPKIIMPIQGLTDLSKLAEIVEAGLPNITGSVSSTRLNRGEESEQYASGAFSWIKTSKIASSAESNANDNQGFDIDASRCSSVYGNSKTVQQEQIRYPYFIQVATGVEKTEDVDRDIVLNNPFFFGMYQWFEVEPNNASWLISNGTFHEKKIYSDYYDWLLRIYNGTETQNGVSVKLHTEAYSDEDFVINQEEETFRLPLRVKQVFFYSQNIPVVGNGMALGLTNATDNYAPFGSSVGTNGMCLDKSLYGQSVGVKYDGVEASNDKALGITTDATKSGIEAQLASAERTDLKLYFYVGVVNQDAPLINSGRALEILPKKLDKYNFYNKMTNCITEIPQRIKYTLEDGVLTLKAGSVVIVPYGVEDLTEQYPKGTPFEGENFIVYDTQYTQDRFFVWAECVRDLVRNAQDYTKVESRYYFVDLSSGYIGSGTTLLSGTTNPTSTKAYSYMYNTATNLIGATGADNVLKYTYPLALPLFIGESDTNTFNAKITQVFNGYSYMGGVSIHDKGIKYLIPNGRNDDGTLKNVEITTDKITIFIHDSGFTNRTNQAIFFNLNDRYTYPLGGSYTLDNYTNTNGNLVFDTKLNKYFYNSASGGKYNERIGVVVAFANLDANAQFTSLQYNQPFRAIDKYEASGLGMPSNKYIDLTLGASNTTYTAPANGWYVVSKKGSSGHYVIFTNDNNGLQTVNVSNGGSSIEYFPAKKGDVIRITYNLTGATDKFRFIYAEGEI